MVVVLSAATRRISIGAWGWFGVKEGFERGNCGLDNRLCVGMGVGRGRGHFGLLFGLIVRAFYSDEMG